MALQAVTSFGTFKIPGAYVDTKVLAQPAGLAVNGVVVLVGEAAMGPAFSDETDITQNIFGPDELGRLAAKYGSGRLVDAARVAAVPMSDPDIQGAPVQIIPIKTNVSGKAQAVLTEAGLTNYGTLFDRSYGEPGNTIRFTILGTDELPPSVQFAFMPGCEIGASDDATLSVRVNGGAVASLSLTAAISPTVAVGSVVSGSSTGLNSLANVMGTGGLNRGVLTGALGTNTLGLALGTAVNSVVITLGGTGLTAWATTPSVGDTLIIGNTTYNMSGAITEASVLVGAGNANIGSYVVTGATATTISATKLHDGVTTGLTAPVAVTAATIGTETTTDVICYSPVTITNVSGTSRAVLAAGNVGALVTGTASGTQLTLTIGTGTWNVTPAVGDYIFIPSTAPAAWHASGANGGYYRVTAATSLSLTLTRLQNGNPASFAATAIAAAANLVCLRPAIDGLGKSLELFDGAGSRNVTTELATLTGGAVTFLASAGVANTNFSSAERTIALAAVRQDDNTSETVTAGGDVVLRLGCTATTATAVITDTTLTLTPTGGSASAQVVTLKSFKTIGALADFVNSKTGYQCIAGTNSIAQQPLFVNGRHVLDRGTYTIANTYGSHVSRIKRDAYAFFSALQSSSVLLQLGNPEAAASTGLPEDMAATYLTGGTRGATTNLSVTNALAACEKLRCNFVCALFATDATTDIAAGTTDSGSTYTIAAIHVALKSHVLAMSTVKRKRNRQGFVGFDGTFINAKSAAGTLATFRVAMPNVDFKAQDANGDIATFQSWMTAVDAAAAQAAAFYKSIFGKSINTSGIVAADATFDPNNDTQVEDALSNGILVARARANGGFEYVSDQTTYAVDDNFVYNSIQAVYAADVVSLTVAQRMEDAFKGKSLADVSAAAASGVFATIMQDLKRIKLIAASSDAPAGYKNAAFKIVGPTLYVQAEIKLATCLYFIPIQLQISEVTQTA